MAPTAPLPDLPPPPVTGTVGDGRPFVIALSFTLMGGLLAGWRLDSPRTLTDIVGISLMLGGIAEGLALRLCFVNQKAPDGMATLSRFPVLKAAPWYARAFFVCLAWWLSRLPGDGHWHLATSLFGVLTAAWLMPELVRSLDRSYCVALRRLGIVRRPQPPLPIAMVQGMALLQAALGVFVVLRWLV